MAFVVVAAYPDSAKTWPAASSSCAIRRSPRAWRRLGRSSVTGGLLAGVVSAVTLSMVGLVDECEQ